MTTKKKLDAKIEQLEIENFKTIVHFEKRITELLTATPSTVAQEKRIANLEEKVKTLGQSVAYEGGYEKRITALYTEVKDQREDYHDHIKQLVTDNEAAHNNLEKKVLYFEESWIKDGNRILVIEAKMRPLEDFKTDATKQIVFYKGLVDELEKLLLGIDGRLLQLMQVAKCVQVASDKPKTKRGRPRKSRG